MKSEHQILIEFLKKEGMDLVWFNEQKYKKTFGALFIKRAIRFTIKELTPKRNKLAERSNKKIIDNVVVAHKSELVGENG